MKYEQIKNEENGVKYLVSENGNKVSLTDRSLELATELLSNMDDDGCTDCTDCINCNSCDSCDDCSYCCGCVGCVGCRHCTHCSECRYCDYCSDCKLSERCKSCVAKTGVTDTHVTYKIEDRDIPVIDSIHKEVLKAIDKEGCILDMNHWHICSTTHCRAGWVVHLAGDAGAELEELTSTAFAAQQIYRVSSDIPVSPNRFYEDFDDAMRDIIRCAEEEKSKIKNNESSTTHTDINV